MEELISKYECRLGVMRDVEAPREVFVVERLKKSLWGEGVMINDEGIEWKIGVEYSFRFWLYAWST